LKGLIIFQWSKNVAYEKDLPRIIGFSEICALQLLTEEAERKIDELKSDIEKTREEFQKLQCSFQKSLEMIKEDKVTGAH